MLVVAFFLAGYYFVPGPFSGYTTLTYRGMRGIYNSGYVGATVATLTSILIALIGFYLVSGAISTDRKKGIGCILATTSLPNRNYISGKYLGAFLYLSIFPIVLWIATVFMQWWRGEDSVELLTLLWPFLLLPLATAFMVTGITMLFENISWLRGNFGLVAYFFIWVSSIILPLIPNKNLAPYLDLSGITILTHSLAAHFNDTASLGNSQITIGIVEGVPSGTFEWGGIPFDLSVVWPRIGWVILGIGSGMLSIAFFDRFSLAYQTTRKKPASSEQLSFGNQQTQTIAHGKLLAYLFPAKTTSLNQFQFYFHLWKAELKLICKINRWFLPTCGVTTLLAFILPVAAMRYVGISLAFLLAIGILSDIACRETAMGTWKYIATSPIALKVFPFWKWCVGVSIVLMFSAGFEIRYLLLGKYNAGLSLLGGIAFVVAWAVIAGILTTNRKTFIVSFSFFWFLVSTNSVPPWLDYAGIQYEGQSVLISSIYISLAMVAILFLTYVQRKAHRN